MHDVFPVNDYGPLMPGLVMAAVAVVHVFLAQFAVGGGFLLCYFPWLAMTNRNPSRTEYPLGSERAPTDLRTDGNSAPGCDGHAPGRCRIVHGCADVFPAA